MTTTRAATTATTPQRPPTASLGTSPYLVVDTLMQQVNVPGVPGGPGLVLHHGRGDIAWLAEIEVRALLARGALVRHGEELPPATPLRPTYQESLDQVYAELGVVETGVRR